MLFESWFPDVDEVKLNALVCGVCGFMTYSPRPERKDLDAKYRFLNSASSKTSLPQFSSQRALGLDRARAQWVFDAVRSHIRPAKPLRVLDYGGGDGKLMLPFLDSGDMCFILDYNEDCIEGVTRLGAELSDLRNHERFDVIVASHVLEHLAHPREDLQELRNHLAPNGVIYIEVPSEILGGLWIDSDPVTHVNFFTLGSLMRLVEQANLGVAAAGKRVANYGRTFRDTLWTVARHRADMTESARAVSDIDEYLRPPRRRTLLLIAELAWKIMKTRLRS